MTLTAVRHLDVIHVTRAQAHADGALIDATRVARKMRFRVPVAISRAVWLDCVHWDDAIEDAKTGFTAQDTDGRLHDLVWEAVCAARAARGGRRTEFTLARVPVGGKGSQPRTATLVMTIGPGDHAEPVVTIMFPGEE